MIYGIILMTILSSIGNLSTITGSFYNQHLGKKALCFGDVNGDGFSDLIYTATLFSAYPTVWISPGGPNFDNVPDVELTYNQPYYGNFGYALWSTDINRDGYDDIIVSNPIEYGLERENRENYEKSSIESRHGREIFIYYGGTNMSGLHYPDITIQCPPPVANDLYEFGLDLCTVNYCFGGQWPPDPYPDLVVGCPERVASSLSGKVFVFKGPSYTEYVELYWLFSGDRLGYSVTAADFNHDGIDEIVAGAYAVNSEKGGIAVWYAWDGMYEPINWRFGTQTGNRFGFDVSSGDVTNDRWPDLIISEYHSTPNKVHISYGYYNWGWDPLVINQTLTGLHSNYDWFGICTAHCNDVNNDGIGDVIVGASQNGYVGVGNGYAAVYFGGEGSINNTPDFVIYGEAYDDAFGEEVNVKAGDINGDGYADFAVSAPCNDAGGTYAGRVYIYGELNLLSSDPLALAYNGNRHLARNPTTGELFLVYTCNGKVLFTHSTDQGQTWDYTPFEVGEGSYPAIALAGPPNYLPSVTWTDSIGGLWYRRKITVTQWSEVYHLYDPWPIWLPQLNSPPSIAITPTVPSDSDSVHIICTLHSPANGPINQVGVYSFQIYHPMQGSFAYIEGGVGPGAGPIRSFPSITRCALDNSLHAVWQRADTICYATRQIGQTWNNWGPRFGNQGLQSAHPFVETYGDMVYVVWQKKEGIWGYEDVYKASNLIYNVPPQFTWVNFSQTPDTRSLFPVNASGFFTVYVDEITPYPNCGWEIFYKVHPEDIAFNISQTLARSTYPQSVARFTAANSYLYTAWLEGDNIPYEIRFKKIRYIPMAVPYLTSANGYETPSSYLIARDSFISDWQIPVDVGYETITYQFPLEPGYRYKIKVVTYHESSGQWREWVKIDGKLKHLIKYNSYQPETLEFWIPTAFYKDGIIEVVFDRINGDFATAGPIYIYRYEYEEDEGEAGGAMAYETHSYGRNSFIIAPNPFATELNITAQLAGCSQKISLRIYDIAGRLVKKLYDGVAEYNFSVKWYGEDENGRKLSPGVYFLKFTNADTKESVCHKIVKVE